MIRLCLSALLLLTAWATPALAQNGQPPAAADPADALPPGFQGKVSYFGNHTGTVVSALTYSGGPKKDCPRPDHRCPERIGGSLEVTLEFDGDVVRGKFRGTGGLRDSQFVGRRTGATDCQLYDRIDGAVWQGHCGAQLFRGSVISPTNAAVQVDLYFQALGVSVFDYAEWYRDQREQIRRKQRYEALIEELQNGDPDYRRRFEIGVELDSYGWDNHELRVGSVRDFHIEKAPRGSGYDRLYVVSFDLRGGGSGRALGHVRKNSLLCVEFDFGTPNRGPSGRCRALDRPPAPPDPPRRPPESESLFPDDDPGPALPNGN
jgi:hypothetical protein